jgi:hypothetical protein
MESLKNLLPGRSFTIPPKWLFVGQFALIFGVLTLGVLWLITPPPSSMSQGQTVATTGRATTAPAFRPSTPASEVSDAEEQATTQTSEAPVPETESASATSGAETTTPVVPVSAPVTQTVATTPPFLASTPTTLTKPLPAPEELPELISVASNGTQKFAVLRLGNAVQTVGVADRIGSWQVQQIRSAQVTIQQGKRTLVLGFGGSTRTPSAASFNNNARPTPTFQPPPDENRLPPQQAPQPPQVDNGSDSTPENENTTDR